MAGHDIIVIGASAGGVKALRELTSGLPADLTASIFVVLHLLPWHKSELASILSRSGPLPAIRPRQDEIIEPGRIYVAPPDRHLLIEKGHIQLGHGPKENRHRPAIDPLFRSAAVAYGPRVIGVILTGCMGDGSAGLWSVRRHGGIAIVQDPEQAEQPEMPRAALQCVDVDHVVGIHEMPDLLTRLVNEEVRYPITRSAGELP